MHVHAGQKSRKQKNTSTTFVFNNLGIVKRKKKLHLTPKVLGNASVFWLKLTVVVINMEQPSPIFEPLKRV